MKFTYPLLLVLVSCCLSVLTPQQVCQARDPAEAAAAAEHRELRKSAVYRGLTVDSEQTRRRTILNCRQQSIHLSAELPSLLGASRRHLKAAETENNIRTSTNQLLYLLGSLHEPEVESLFIDALDSPLLGIRLISTDILGQFQFHGAIDALKQQVSRPEYNESYGYRFNVLRAFTRMHHPDAVDFLTVVHPTLNGQLRHLIGTALKSVTVADFLGDEERFREWEARQNPKEKEETKDENGEDKIVFKTAGYESESQNRIKFGKPQYYGIDVHAQRMMFIIDHSGSMQDFWGGMSRLARAKLELIKVVRELPETTEFAIMFYETNVRVWRKSLVLATEENKLEAITFIRKLGFGDRTNTYGALRKSLTFDQDLETVFLLTDGQPTIGETVEPKKILVDILGRNRFRHLNFNTIGIAVNPNTEAFLKQLAIGSGGEYRRAL
ncbi:VWA domain-containing protein [bacterium]|nr:VWA domain-containing protein [bacterium]